MREHGARARNTKQAAWDGQRADERNGCERAQRHTAATSRAVSSAGRALVVPPGRLAMLDVMKTKMITVREPGEVRKNQ